MLSALERDWRKQFGRIVTLAQGAHRTRCCALAVLDGSSLSYRVGRGFSPTDCAPETDTVLGALHAPEGILVADGRRDRRLLAVDRVRDGSIRFYAGYPIYAPRGEPVGVLSVFDPAPRLPDSRELLLLKRFATTTQQRLHVLMHRLRPRA